MPEVLASALVAGLVVRQLHALLWPSDELCLLNDIEPLHSVPPSYSWAPPWHRSMADQIAWLCGAMFAVLVLRTARLLARRLSRKQLLDVRCCRPMPGAVVGKCVELCTVRASDSDSPTAVMQRIHAWSPMELAHDCLTQMLEPSDVSTAVVVLNVE